MERRELHLNIPLSEEVVRDLRVDDVVYLNGTATALFYDDHFQVIMDKIKAGEELPMELKDGVGYHTGAIYVKHGEGEYDMLAIGSTTSAKFNALTPEFIRLTGIRAFIGKGGMDAATLEAMEECGCVYLAASGGCSSFYAPKVKITGEYWPELTPVWNQRLRFELTECGPFFVGMDAHGNSIYDQCEEETRKNMAAIYGKLGVTE